MTLDYWIVEVGENALQDSILVYGEPWAVSVRDNEGPLENVSEENWGAFRVIKFNMRETLKAGSTSTITIEFTKATSALDGRYRYEIRYLWSTRPITATITASLSEEYEFTVEGENTSVSSTNGEWRFLWLKAEENHFFAAVTFGPRTSENRGVVVPGKAPGPFILYYLPLMGALVVLLVAAAIAMKFRPTVLKPAAPPRVGRPRVFSKEDVRKLMLMLTEHERKVVEVLLERDNLTQRALCDRTKIPKATMSRVLQRLENKGIVGRTGFGASKRVLLTRWARRWRTK
jgi:uncharacterized membrane protein